MTRGFATALSAVFHPLLVPFYLFYIVCYQLPGVVILPPLPDRWLVLAVVWGFTFLLPCLGTVVLIKFGLVDSLQMPEREQRAWPLLLAASSFGAAAWLLHRPGLFDPLLPRMMTGMTVAVLLTFLLTLRWKISAHGVGMGGAAGLLAVLHLSEPDSGPTVWWLAGTILAAGAVGSARLALNAHTEAQVWAGLALGAGLVLGVSAGLALG
ncbi:hypothetical protein [Hymenobacter glacieicola]|uniref:Phosphatidic acid phosphatase type 2/haloperoxidase domain-containing protein n=1 Tax=Hymenobacter glacieicola TaxID=1562124 RepID=A0ABQ1WW66_9BACT|nr:hypothetical protein [Hymenobacter glacieicola]GGG44518.1 hypothetical protein GCM10011378_21080 [Hymenobacter glacieicola]